jgi:hypothetical protein
MLKLKHVLSQITLLPPHYLSFMSPSNTLYESWSRFLAIIRLSEFKGELCASQVDLNK